MWDPEEYSTLLNDAVSRGETIVFAGKCSIRYSGRAESQLGDGDRVIVIKSDKTLLVHQPHGSNPINYMKGDASHRFSVQDGKLVLKCSHLSEKESLEAVFTRVYFFNSHRLEDGQVISIVGTEEDMSDMLMERPELVEPGFRPVSREEQTKYGFIDVLGTDKDGVLTVVECKRYVAELSAVTQLRRYVEKIMQSKGITRVRGILAAPKITDNARRMLEGWGFSFVAVRPPKYLEEFDKKQARLEFF